MLLFHVVCGESVQPHLKLCGVRYQHVFVGDSHTISFSTGQPKWLKPSSKVRSLPVIHFSAQI